jgi:ATP-dependent exoDNAse (exonuclease V) beta subunit
MQNNFNKFTIQKSFAISAGAGSGKTYTLSRRYINAVLGFDFFVENEKQENFIETKDRKKAKLSEIVTMTYTEAAALEMKERIFDLMEKIIEFDPHNKNKDGDFDSISLGIKKLNDDEKKYVKKRLQDALQNSNSAFISTIHSFCLDTITSNSDIARVDSKLQIIQDDEKQKILDEVVFEVLDSNSKLSIEVFQVNDRFKINQLIEKYATDSNFRKSFDSFMSDKSLNLEIYKEMIKELFIMPDTQDALNEMQNDEKRLKWLQKYIQNFESFEAVKWSSVCEVKAPTLGEKKYPQTVTLKDKLDGLVQAYSHIDIEKEEEFLDKLETLHTLLKEIHCRYQESLKEENKIDFDSIISMTAKIVQQIDTHYKYIMVDEFQDTNSLQNKIVTIISKDRNLFLVGDSKQSIYSFQGAELEVFHDAIGELESVPMNVNYRSDKEILTFVNDIFKELLKKDENEDSFIVSNYKAGFNKSDELQPSSQDKASGKVEFLISQEEGYQVVSNQMQDIAKFIKALVDDKIEGYEEIKQMIKKSQKAIGILFDSSAKMLELKHELDLLGVAAKVSATENFYHTREVNDIFALLKSLEILQRKEMKKESTLYAKEKFYIAAALRSMIVRKNEEEIVELFSDNDFDKIVAIFKIYLEKLPTLSISLLIKFIVDQSKLLDTFLYIGDIEQRAANIEKLIDQTIQYESNNSSNLYEYLQELERNIYFKDIKEDEAFYKADNLESIELCTIHSTKGLAYPMVILAQSEKGLHANASGEMGLSFASFTLKQDDEKVNYSAVGFKVDNYEPLIYRILKQVMKNKHEAEKKRLLYVALTRAKHNLVVAGSLYKKSNSDIGLSDNSYLGWMVKSLQIDAEELYNKSSKKGVGYINNRDFENITGEVISPQKYEQVKLEEKSIKFNQKSKITASNSKEKPITTQTIKQAKVGTAIHAILAKYWDRLEDENILEAIYAKYQIMEDEKEKIQRYIENFKTTTVYKKLKDGGEHNFEIEMNMFESNNQIQGIIDLLYYDKDGWVVIDFKSNNIQDTKNLDKFAKEQGYDRQLQTYKELCEYNNLNVKKSSLIFLDNGVELNI